MGPFALRALAVLSCLVVAAAVPAPAEQCTSSLADETSLIQVTTAPEPHRGGEQEPDEEHDEDELQPQLRRTACANVEGTKQSLGDYKGKYEVFEWVGGKYYITAKVGHLKVNPASPDGDLYLCSAFVKGGWGVGMAECCTCKAPDPGSSTLFSEFAPKVIDGNAYKCYYDCSLVENPEVTCAETGAPTPAPPTPVPTPSPTSTPSASPTSSPSASPTPAPTKEAPKVSGDPHVTNLDGERFNLIRTGMHKLLRLPRQTTPGQGPPALLEVQGRVEEERHCTETYVKEILISGSWLRKIGNISLRTAGSEPRSAGAIHLEVNGSAVSVEDLRGSGRLAGLVEQVTLSGSTHANADGKGIQRLNFLTVALRFPAASLTVEWLCRQVPGSSVNHLNLKITELPRPKIMEVGGVMGHDDHTLAATPSEDCKQASDLISAEAPLSRMDDARDGLDANVAWFTASYEEEDAEV